mmetsp:Transcript_13852/g.40131  ORF Transcript_13852/g.40131 Transcript_13852/m.40131 type:complete len:261 (-) Transcript_13852:1029-1811(-)
MAAATASPWTAGSSHLKRGYQDDAEDCGCGSPCRGACQNGNATGAANSAGQPVLGPAAAAAAAWAPATQCGSARKRLRRGPAPGCRAPQSPQEQQSQAGAGGDEGCCTSGVYPNCEAATAEEWVTLLVSHMAAAANMDDAREKAAHVLALFEKAVAAKQGDARPQDHAAQALATKLAEAARESGILKRAVQIQSAKIERASADRDAALAHAQQLSEQLAGASDVARQLQAANYALSLQLQQATASAQFAGLCGRRPPDVF